MQLAWVFAALLPACDFTIQGAADWQHVNDSDKTVICVAPAPTYTVEQVGVIKLTASGTPDRPRWLRWANNDESAHPALVPASQTAAVSQFDLIGNNWIIDRLVVRDAIYEPQVIGSGNVLQRMLFEKPRPWAGRLSGVLLRLTSGSDNAVVDSVFRDPIRVPGIDSGGIYLHQAERSTIRGNEFIDLVDGIANGPVMGGGHQFIENEFYQTPAIYTDCAGHLKSSGNCSCSESMAIDPKGPADKAETYIERNLIWGFQKGDPACAGSGSPGVALDFGAGVPYTLTRHYTVRGNVVIGKGLPHGIFLWAATEDMTISGNYISGTDYAISNSYGQRITIEDNIYFNNGVNYLTGTSAQGTVYDGNRNAGAGQLCVTIRHITNPGKLCTLF